MTIEINRTPIDNLQKAPNIQGIEKVPVGRTWALLHNN